MASMRITRVFKDSMRSQEKAHNIAKNNSKSEEFTDASIRKNAEDYY